MDVTNFEKVKKAVAEVKDNLGSIDILVNNAGWDRMIPFIKTAPDFWDKVIDINYGSHNFNCLTCPVRTRILNSFG
jgi:2-hydroxycyclohexanecarboxyl-CoA dehydrogenase